MNVLSLFDGMSCGRIALERAGIPVTNYFASEIDPYAIKVSKANYPDIIQIGDVSKVYGGYIREPIDLLIGGSPCQGFSNAGNGLNFNDPRSKLFFEYVRILKEVKPKYFLLENVCMKKEWRDIISEQIGVEPVKIDSSLISAQSRKRLYWTNIPNIHQPIDSGILLQDKLTSGVAIRSKSQTILSTIYKENAKSMVKRKKWGLLVKIGEIYRKVNPTECERLQSVPDDYTSSVSSTRRYMILGNAWECNTITHIFKNIPL